MAKPLLFITGFLGAGKTTLLRNLLSELRKRDRTADVILNDFENAEIDASTLEGQASSLFPIAASCACCGSLEDLVELCLAAQKSDGDVLLIELNGTADPLPLLETFTLLEEKMSFFPRWQAGVVDARHWGNREDFASLEERQVETATHWQLTHAEDLTESEAGALSQSVEIINPYATQVGATQLAAELAKAKELRSDTPDALSQGKLRPGTNPRRGHALSHRLTGYQIPMPGRYEREQIIQLIEALPGEVVRAKALVELEDSSEGRWLFDRTGLHPVQGPQQVDGLSRAPSSLLCIGPRLSPEKIHEICLRHLA